MDFSNVELTLSLKPSSFVPKSFKHLLTDLYQIENASAKLSKLKIYLNQHKEEMRRVQAFDRDLPHCMLLLKDALEVIQEKISKINNGSVEADRQTVYLIRKKRDQPEIPIISPSNHEWVPTVRPDKRSQTEKMEDSAGTNPMPKFNNNSTVPTINNRSPPSPMEITRNGRRIWMPALHSRFVKALHDLGGVEVATPKRIRQRMQVKGLTNDQVKSHLQKFRIYKRAGVQVPQAGAEGSSSSRDAAQTLHHQPAVAMSSEEQRRDPYRSTSRQSQPDPYPFSINYLSAAIPALFSTQTSGSSSREIVGPLDFWP